MEPVQGCTAKVAALELGHRQPGSRVHAPDHASVFPLRAERCKRCESAAWIRNGFRFHCGRSLVGKLRLQVGLEQRGPCCRRECGLSCRRWRAAGVSEPGSSESTSPRLRENSLVLLYRVEGNAGHFSKAGARLRACTPELGGDAEKIERRGTPGTLLDGSTPHPSLPLALTLVSCVPLGKWLCLSGHL